MAFANLKPYILTDKTTEKTQVSTTLVVLNINRAV